MRLFAAVLAFLMILPAATASAQNCSSYPNCYVPPDPAPGSGAGATMQSYSASSVGDPFITPGSAGDSQSSANKPVNPPTDRQGAMTMALASMLEDNKKQAQKYQDALGSAAAAGLPGVPKDIATDPAAAIQAQMIKDYAAFGANDVDVQAVMAALLGAMQEDLARERQLRAQILDVLRRFPQDDAVKGGQIVSDYLSKQQKLINQQQAAARDAYDAQMAAATGQLVAAMVSATSQVASGSIKSQPPSQTPTQLAPIGEVGAAQQQLVAFGATKSSGGGAGQVDPSSVMTIALAAALEESQRQRQGYVNALQEASQAGAAGVPKSVASDPMGAVQGQIAQQYAQFGAKQPEVQSAIGSLFETAANNPNASPTALSQLMAEAMAGYSSTDAQRGANIAANYLDSQQKQMQQQMDRADGKAEQQLASSRQHVQEVKSALIKLLDQLQQANSQTTIR